MKSFPLNWEKFNAKFSNNVQLAFENFTYYLFCKEFKIKKGIFSYKNQHYIETEPVDTRDSFVTGFQSKYYGGSEIKKNKEEFCKCLDGAKNKYKNLNRIIFYVREISESTNKTKSKPDYITEIEKYGESLDITIEWRVTSNYKAMIYDNPQLSDYYFNEQKGLSDFIEDVECRSKEYLEGIKNEITTNKIRISVPMDSERFEKFLCGDKNIFIVSGEAGVGKSGYVKTVVAKYIKNDLVPIIVSSKEVDRKSMNDICIYRNFNYNIKDVIEFFGDTSNKIFVIDAVEKHKYFDNKETLFNLIKELANNKWKVILTIRNEYLPYIKSLIDPLYKYEEYNIEPIDEMKLRDILKTNKIPIPTEKNILNVIRYPFYLNNYVNISNVEDINLGEFINKIWTNYVCKNHDPLNGNNVKREKIVFSIVKKILKGEEDYCINGNENDGIINELINDGVIIYKNNNKNITFSHDILKELSIYYFLETDNYKNNISNISTTKEREIFNTYIEKYILFIDEEIENNWIEDIVEDKSLPQGIINDILIKIVRSSNQKVLYNLSHLLIKNKNRLLLKVLKLLRVSSNQIDYDIVNRICISNSERDYAGNIFRTPVGESWHAVFDFIYSYKNQIDFNIDLLSVLIEILFVWVHKNSHGKTTRLAGLIALYIKDSYRIENKNLKDLLNKVILFSSYELKNELELIIDKIVKDNVYNYSVKYYDMLYISILNSFDCGYIFDVFFGKMLIVMESILFNNASNYHNEFSISNNIDNKPASAFQTPVLHMLEIMPEETIDFIIGFVNKACINYRNNVLKKRGSIISSVELLIDGNKKIQMCDKNLWLLHRGFVITSDVLESILMALEYWLDKQIDDKNYELVNIYCKKLLYESNNVAITSVVLSVVEYAPKHLFEIAKILTTMKEVFWYDEIRIINERRGLLFSGIDKLKEIYINERKKSNCKKFRNDNFESIIINYQLNSYGWENEESINHNEELQKTLNNVIKNIEKWDSKYQYAYYKININQAHKELTENGDIIFKYNWPEKLIKDRNELAENNKQLGRHLELFNWLRFKFELNYGELKKYYIFEINPVSYLKEIVNSNNEYEYKELNFNNEMLIYALSILIRDYTKVIAKNEYELCIYKLVKMFDKYVANDTYLIISNVESIFFEIFIIVLTNNPNQIEIINRVIVLLKNIDINSLDDKQDRMNNMSNKWPDLFKLIFMEILSEEYNNRKDTEPQITEQNYIYKKIKSKLFHQYLIYAIIKIKRLRKVKLKNINSLILNFNNQYKFLIKGAFKLVVENKDEVDYDYLVRVSNYIYNSTYVQQKVLLDILFKSNNYKCINIILKNLIFEEKRSRNYERFWNIWNYIFPYVVKLIEMMDTSNIDDLIFGTKETLLIYNFSTESEIDFLTYMLKENGEKFFENISSAVGENFYILYSISKAIFITKNELFHNIGIKIIYELIKKSQTIKNYNSIIYKNTIYYIEMCMHYWFYQNNINIKYNHDREILEILDFLIDNGSSLGYILRNIILNF